MDNTISRIRKAAEYWVSMVQEPQRKIQERWGECEKNWEDINREMENIDLPNFSPPEHFTDLQDSQMTCIARLGMGGRDLTDFKYDSKSSKEVRETPNQVPHNSSMLKCQAHQV